MFDDLYIDKSPALYPHESVITYKLHGCYPVVLLCTRIAIDVVASLVKSLAVASLQIAAVAVAVASRMIASKSRNCGLFLRRSSAVFGIEFAILFCAVLASSAASRSTCIGDDMTIHD